MKNAKRTEKQIAASRANGARSKGPVTPQGKQNSSRNSTHHGLLAETVVLAGESQERFLEFLESYIDEYQPTTPTENALVEKMTVARWQQYRIWGIQTAALDHDMAREAENDFSSPDAPTAQRAVASFRNGPDGSSPMQLLLRYNVAADRQFDRALARLLDLRDRKSAARTQQPVETTCVRCGSDGGPRPSTPAAPPTDVRRCPTTPCVSVGTSALPPAAPPRDVRRSTSAPLNEPRASASGRKPAA